MKTIHYFLIALLSLVSLFQAQAQAPEEYKNYSEHDIWQDSYPVYDAATYKGKYYIVQNFDYGIIRLIQFNVSIGGTDGTVRDVNHWDLSDHLSFYSDQADVELVEYHDALYIFGYIRTADGGRQHIANKLVVDDKGNATLSKVPLPPFMKGTGNNPGMAATVYKGSLCLFYVEKGSHEVRMGFTKNPEDGNGWQVCKAIDQLVYSSNILTQDTWDVCTWFGQKKEGNETKMTEQLVFGLIAGPNMWAYTFDGEPEKSDHGKWTSASFKNGASDVVSFSLKMLQGNIVEVGSDKNKNNNNPVQFIYAIRKSIVTGGIHHREIQTQEFFPSSNSFGGDGNVLKTNLPYGYFGAAALSLPLGDTKTTTGQIPTIYTTYFQQFIILFRGACDNHFNIGSHYAIVKSNRKKASSFIIPTNNMLKNSELRGFCTLTGVLEGPPPIAIDNDSMYTTMLPSFNDFLSSIRLGTEETKFVSEESETKLALDAGLGPDTDEFTIQALGGFELKQVSGKSETTTVQYGNTFVNGSKSKSTALILYYKVPELIRYDMTYLTSSGKDAIEGRPQVLGFKLNSSTMQIVTDSINSPLSHKYIRIDEPWRLENWHRRHVSTPGMDVLPNVVYNHSIPVKHSTDFELENSQTNTSSCSQTIKLGANTKTPFFQVKEEFSITWDKASSTTLSKNVAIITTGIDEKYDYLFERPNLLQNYTLKLCFLNDSTTQEFTRLYYRDLKQRGLMLEGEKPFILAWDVAALDFKGIMSAAVATSDETIAPDGTRVYNDGSSLVVDTPAGSRIMVYAASGRMEADRLADGVQRFQLPKGVYFVRVVQGNTSKVYKTVKR